MHTSLISRAFALWVPILVATSGLFLFAYWGIQQEYRMAANDPQIAMAEDGAALLDQGASPASLVPRTEAQSAGAPTVDLMTSLDPWLAVFDASGTPLESSASLGSAPLQLPQGVFDTSTWKRVYAEQGVGMTIPQNETRFTWQPSSSARQAVVLVRAADHGYFVASGRSLREVEAREMTLTHGAALFWGVSELAALVVIFLILALS